MVGRNLCEHPAAEKYDVLNPSRNQLDLLDGKLVGDYIKHHKPDMVIHCAGVVGGIQANIKEPLQFLVSNFEMGKNVVLSSRDAGVERLINLGSSCMYPCDAVNPLREESILAGVLESSNEGYALAKIATAKLCSYISLESSEYCYKTLVPCNLYGRYDNFELHRSHLVPAIIRKVHEAKIKGWGEVCIWGSGEVRREFLYAADLADCIWRSVESFDSLPHVMNVGLGHDHSVNDYYRIISDIIGYEGRFVHDLSKPEGMKQKLVDVTRQTQWGWSPRYSLEEGLCSTYQYYKQELGE